MTDSVLDQSGEYERLDPSGIGQRIAALPEQMDEAWDAGSRLALPWGAGDVDRVVVLGMGGSGIGGSLLAAWAVAAGAKTPVMVVRGYTPPAYVDARSLVLASSNSGNTEEILSGTDAVIAAGAKVVVMTTGGKLLEVAKQHRLPAFTYSYTGEPRSALGWSFASLLAICGRAGVLPDAGADLRGATEHMRSLRREISAEAPEASNAAKQLARRLNGKLPAFIGAEALTPVAYRWRTQVNENAKSWGIADELPEMNHNAQAGYGLAKEILPLLHVVFLRHASAHPRIALRVGATSETMREAGVETEILEVPGPSVLTQMLWAVHFGDFASYYLSVLNGVDASPVPGIESLKRVLAGK